MSFLSFPEWSKHLSDKPMLYFPCSLSLKSAPDSAGAKLYPQWLGQKPKRRRAVTTMLPDIAADMKQQRRKMLVLTSSQAARWKFQRESHWADGWRKCCQRRWARCALNIYQETISGSSGCWGYSSGWDQNRGNIAGTGSNKWQGCLTWGGRVAGRTEDTSSCNVEEGGVIWSKLRESDKTSAWSLTF